jgi:hypothetical protein
MIMSSHLFPMVLSLYFNQASSVSSANERIRGSLFLGAKVRARRAVTIVTIPTITSSCSKIEVGIKQGIAFAMNYPGHKNETN